MIPRSTTLLLHLLLLCWGSFLLAPIVNADCGPGCDACQVVDKWLHRDDADADKTQDKDDGQDDMDPAPKTWTAFPGSSTTQRGIDYLYCWESSEYPNLATVGIFAISVVRDFLSNEELQTIIDDCSTITEEAAKALCAAAGVHKVFQNDPDMVCRHHAIALEAVLEDLEIPATIEVAEKMGHLTNMEGHAWVSIFLGDTKECLMDAYNNYYACRPK